MYDPRRRPATALTLSVLATLLLSGCSGTTAPTVTSALRPSAAASVAEATETPSPPATTAPSRSSGPSPSPAEPSANAELIDVTVNGLQIRGHCSGTRSAGQPVVILQAGTGGPDTSLAGIEEHLADHAMVCAWARPGAGESDVPTTLPRPVSEVVTEMHDVLAAHGLEPPYFPIGHSGGAVVVFMFAQAYPKEVAGFVSMNPNPAYSKWMAWANKTELPAEFLDPAEADYRGQNPEGIDFTGNDRMLKDRLPAQMPYAVLYDEDCFHPNCAEALAPEAAIQELLANVGKGGSFVWLHGAGHEMPRTQPERVNEAIDAVWAKATD